MFNEFKDVRQERAGRRRWFEAEDLELVLWLEARDEPIGFQLLYSRADGDRALTWRKESGFVHSRIDDGEGGRVKQTPILMADGAVPWDEIERRFRTHAGSLDEEIATLVLTRLRARR